MPGRPSPLRPMTYIPSVSSPSWSEQSPGAKRYLVRFGLKNVSGQSNFEGTFTCACTAGMKHLLFQLFIYQHSGHYYLRHLTDYHKLITINLKFPLWVFCLPPTLSIMHLVSLTGRPWPRHTICAENCFQTTSSLTAFSDSLQFLCLVNYDVTDTLNG